MPQLLGRLVALVEWWAVALLAAMAALVCLGVFFRYALDSALSWYDEFASYLLVWLTFFGAVVASYHRRHIGFETVVERLPAAARRATELLAEVAVLVFHGIVLYYGWDLAAKMADETAVSLPWVRMGWVFAAIPLAGGLMLLVSLARLAALVSAWREA
jgi:TRAP-type C4-dicarboxylate transport system permease small subunit